ncbi:MAG: hypothetical protein GXY32_05720 [Ruminococcaceae bacterium]|nr:hypothetical protein [Oscillospiraceae bacterium]
MSDRNSAGANGRGHEPGVGRPRPTARKNTPVDDRTRVRGAARPADAQNATDPRAASGRARSGGQRPVKRKTPLQAGTVAKVAVLNVFKALLVVVCLVLIVGAIAMVQVVKYVVETTENDDMIMDLGNYQLSQTSYIMAYNPDNPNAREEEDYIEYQVLIGDSDRVWVEWDEIPKDLVNAVVATEDREFWNHHGVDFRRTIGALINEFIPFQSQFGASTIDQQLVKNLTGDDAVQSEGGDRTEGYMRKIREIFRAWSLNNRYSKDMIMESYLNTMGLSERIAGVGSAARKYFDKEVKDLTLAECATIAGITRAPTYYSPFQNPENCRKRRDDVILFMVQCEYITEAQANEVYGTPLNLKTPAASSATQSTVFSYISDKVYNDVIDDLVEQMGMTYSAAYQAIYNRGWRIYATADLNVQEQLDSIMTTGYEEDGFFMDQNRFPGYEASLKISEDITNAAGQVIGSEDILPQAAVAIVNYEGELIATSGGIGKKEKSLSFNRSIGTVVENADGTYTQKGGVRQVGSTMKPIAAYALGIDMGIISYSKMVMDAPIMARDPNKRNEVGNPIKDWPTNYSNTWRQSKMPIVSAVAESTNTVAAQVGDWVGRQEMYEFLEDTLGISSLVPTDMDLGPLVLGSQTYGISPYELAGAYAMFGGTDTYGVYTTLHSYSKVTDAAGNVVMEPEVMPVQAISPETGYVMNRLLYNVVHTGTYPGGASPTAGGMAIEGEMESVGKTGTTSEDNDRWFVGLTPHYVTAVWWGYDNQSAEQKYTFYRRWSAAARTNIPANIWKAVITPVQENMEVKSFPDVPEGVVTEQFCIESGGLYQAGCPGAMTGYYTSFGVPEPCPGHGAAPEGEAPAEP